MTAVTLQQRYVEQCAQYLGSAMGVEPEAVLGRSRMYLLSLARHLIAYRLRTFGWTQTEVGRLLHLDHSSVSHAEHRIPRVLITDTDIADIYGAMPMFGGEVFSDTNLVQLYERLSYLMAEAMDVRNRIDAALAQQDVPRRVERAG